jgi:hypothetical protein
MEAELFWSVCLSSVIISYVGSPWICAGGVNKIWSLSSKDAMMMMLVTSLYEHC